MKRWVHHGTAVLWAGLFLSVVATLSCLAAGVCAQEPPAESPTTRPVVLVLLTELDASAPALTRLEAELRVAGFEPVRSELARDASPVAVRGLASMHDAFAAVRAPDDRSEPVVWLRDPAGDYGLRQLDVPTGTPPTVSALQVVAFLSARQLELELGIPDEVPPTPAPPSAAERAIWSLGSRSGEWIRSSVMALGAGVPAVRRPIPSSLRADARDDDAPLGLEFELSGAMSLSGVGAHAGPAARVGWSDPKTGVGPRLSWLGPLFGNDLASEWGAIALRQEMISLDAGLAIPLSPVVLRPWLGLAVAHVVARGDDEVDAWTPALGAGLGTTVSLTSWLATRLDLGAFLATSPVDIRTGPDDTARIGSPTFTASLGFVLTL